MTARDRYVLDTYSRYLRDVLQQLNGKIALTPMSIEAVIAIAALKAERELRQ